MPSQYKIRFIFIAALWLVLCYIVASGIVVWAPLYKKYIQNGKGKDER